MKTIYHGTECVCGCMHWRRKISETVWGDKAYRQITIYCDKCHKIFKQMEQVILSEEQRRLHETW